MGGSEGKTGLQDTNTEPFGCEVGSQGAFRPPPYPAPLPQLIQFESIQFNKHLLNVSYHIPFPSSSRRPSSFFSLCPCPSITLLTRAPLGSEC